MKPEKKKAATPGEARGENHKSSSQQQHSNMKAADILAKRNNAFVKILLLLLAHLDAPAGAAGFTISPLDARTIAEAVRQYNAVRVRINARIAADDDYDGSDDNGIRVGHYPGYYTIDHDGFLRVLLVPGREVTLELRELKPSQVKGGFIISLPAEMRGDDASR